MQEPLEPQCPLSKYQWKRTEKEPKACPRIVDKHLLQILTRKAGDARIMLTVDQMKTLGLGHMCWDGYVEVGNQFYRPLLPPIIKEGMIQEIRNMWQYVAIPYQELHDHHITDNSRHVHGALPQSDRDGHDTGCGRMPASAFSWPPQQSETL